MFVHQCVNLKKPFLTETAHTSERIIIVQKNKPIKCFFTALIGLCFLLFIPHHQEEVLLALVLLQRQLFHRRFQMHHEHV